MAVFEGYEGGDSGQRTADSGRQSPAIRYPLSAYFFSLTFALPAAAAPLLGLSVTVTASVTLFAFFSAFTPAFVNLSVTVPLPDLPTRPLPEATAVEPFRPLTVSVPAPGPATLTLMPLFSAFLSEVFEMR